MKHSVTIVMSSIEKPTWKLIFLSSEQGLNRTHLGRPWATQWGEKKTVNNLPLKNKNNNQIKMVCQTKSIFIAIFHFGKSYLVKNWSYFAFNFLFSSFALLPSYVVDRIILRRVFKESRNRWLLVFKNQTFYPFALSKIWKILDIGDLDISKLGSWTVLTHLTQQLFSSYTHKSVAEGVRWVSNFEPQNQALGLGWLLGGSAAGWSCDNHHGNQHNWALKSRH